MRIVKKVKQESMNTTKGKMITVPAAFRLPETVYILEAGDRIRLLNSYKENDYQHGKIKIDGTVLESIKPVTNSYKKKVLENMPPIPQEIYNQLGHKALYMMGYNPKVSSYSDNSLNIRFTGSRTVNFLKITLNGKDLYDLEFGYMRGMNYKIVAEHKDIYASMLHSVIEKETGLYLSL